MSGMCFYFMKNVTAVYCKCQLWSCVRGVRERGSRIAFRQQAGVEACRFLKVFVGTFCALGVLGREHDRSRNRREQAQVACSRLCVLRVCLYSCVLFMSM